MTLQQLASIDLYALSKAQLKNYVKEAREEWGRAIDLRSAKQPELIEYLQLFLNWKVEQVQEVEEVTPVEEVAPTFFEEIATVNNEAEDTEDYTSCYRYQGHKIEVYKQDELFIAEVVSINYTSTPRCLESWVMQLAEEAIDAHLEEAEEGTTDTHTEVACIFKVNYLKLGTYYSDGQSTYKEPSLDIAKNDTQAQYYLDGAAARNLDFEIETELVTIADPEQALVFKQSGFAQIELTASPIINNPLRQHHAS